MPVNEAVRRELEPRPARSADEVGGGRLLATVLPLLRDTLVSIADEARHMLVVTDVRGHVLWCAGRVGGVRRAGDGTGRRHPVRDHHSWTGAACPIHDPDSGEVIGAVDVTGPARTLHPTTLALVAAAARLAEGHLAARLAMRDERLLARNLAHLAGLRDEPGALLTPGGRVLAAQPSGWLPARVELPAIGDRVALGEAGDGLLEPLAEGWLLRLRRAGPPPRPVLSLPFLGATRALARLDGCAVRLTRRQADVLALLALHPGGRTADELATALHGDAGGTVAVRAETDRLRVALGADVLRTRPYRLRARVDADFVAVRAALARGDVRGAARAYRGPLLPGSESPGVREERGLLATALRRAVLDSRDADAMWALAGTADGRDDAELSRRLLRTLPARDPRRPVLTARLTITAP